MRERDAISTLEIDTTEKSQVLISHHTDSSIIKLIASNLEKISGDTELCNYIYSCTEYTSSQVGHMDLINRESSRPIGYTKKIRVVFAVLSSHEASLLIVANKEFVTFQDIAYLYDYILGKNLNLMINKATNEKNISYKSPSWGVPTWNNSSSFSQSNSFTIGNLDANYTLDEIANALLLTLGKYGSKNSSILIEENNLTEQKFRQGSLDDKMNLNISDELPTNDESSLSFDAGIVATDTANSDYQYIPYLTTPFPISAYITTYNGVAQTINISASERFIHLTVLQQFVDLFSSQLQYSLKDDNSLNPLLIRDVYEKHNLKKSYKSDVESNALNLLETLSGVVREFPDQIAVSDENCEITYSELDKKSDFIAKKLIAYGIKEGVKVVVSLDQTANLITTLISVVKAGGTYIPVDPNYPIERISFVINDSSAEFMITDLPDFLDMPNITVISSNDLINKNDGSLEAVRLSNFAPTNAYVIYTSGTSGQPKGVLVPSQNIVSLITATKEEFKLSHRDVWTMFHSASFDFSIWEMWGSLLTGAQLVVVPRPIAKSPYDFYELLMKKNVTILNQTPSAFYALQKIDAEHKKSTLTSLRLIIFGGEALDTYKTSNWLKKYPVSCCRLVNMYGITETTVHVTFRNILHKDPAFLSKSVGAALPGWKISIRDAASGVPCLKGMEGEIWVGGAGLSYGYLNKEDLTNERFVFDSDNGERWYRSGDLGRERPDGTIDYLGRIDNQVKIRGFRIELDEIRSVIQKIPYVNDVAIVLHDGDDVQSSQKQILAFVESFEKVDSNTIRQYLKSKIPEYMIPARIINVAEIPVTINGKIDQKSLMLMANNQDQESYVEESKSKDPYMSIWSKVLGHDIEPNDNFFDAGGNSLLAVELLSALKREVDNSLTLRDIYIYSSPKVLKEFLATK
ncbi:hypothetical protein COL60_10325 [Bacillus pseudomycoides]|uniref:non-ribosomal peptide synthetase n=1 Tax=Bacillus pseudomycoides TaxID=64104 RepID=UPI000BF78668|nr:non-ribosomal peptide synthetase [Bacillus pseudomycoides]PFZ10492.1 hypothetical protein COL60_10325 [Bacillus pseudomycoides]